MNIIILSLSLLGLILSETNLPIENDVIIIKDSTFESVIKKYDYLMIFFYAPWCIRCKNFQSEYEKSAKILQNEGLFLAKVDATTEKFLSRKFNVKRFPVIKLFIKGEPIDYYGERKASNLVNWIRRKTNGPATELLTSMDIIEKFINDNDVSIIYFGDDKFDIEEYIKVARKYDDYQFAIVKESELIKKYSKQRNIILYKKFDEGKREIDRSINEKNIEDFIDLYSYPKLMKYNEKAAKLIFQKKFPVLILFTEKNSQNFQHFEKILKNISEKINYKIKVIISDLREGLSSQHSELFGIKENELPSVRIIDPRGKIIKKYKMDLSINEKNILNFIQDWNDNKLKSYVKSEEIPKNNDDDVHIVVGQTFEKEVINNDKDVIILFYSPWCFNCKALLPKYQEMAKILKDNNKLLIAKINAVDNEIESLDILEYPTIKFYPGNKKDKPPISYNGDKSVNDMIDFIKLHANNKIQEIKDKKNEEL